MIEKIGHYSLTTPASVYDEEAMTALELAGRTAGKVNECIDEVNRLPTTVKEEVEKHIEGGAFDEQINEHTEELTHQMTATEQEFEEEVKVLRSQLANLLGSIQAGGGTGSMDNEIIDARVGFNGEINPSLGEAIRKQLGMALKSHNALETGANFNDAKNAPANSILYISAGVTEDDIADLPAYGTGGMLITMNFSSNNPAGVVQFFVNSIEFFWRYQALAGDALKWYPWNRAISSNRPGCTNYAVGISSNANLEIDYAEGVIRVTGGGHIWGGHIFVSVASLTPNYVSFDVEANGTYQVYIRDNAVGIANMTEYNPGRNDIVIATLHLNTGKKIVQVAYSAGDRLISNIPMDHLCNIFSRVCCCGDSFTAGYINTDGGGKLPSNPTFSWPHYLGKLTGNEYINCGVSGSTVLSWQTAANGLIKARASGKCSAYLLGLGINDKGVTNNVPLGTVSDIGTSASTYYGGLSNIIKELAEISPKAHIFVFTVVGLDDTTFAYNSAVRDVVAKMSETYNVHLLDNANFRHIYVYNQMLDAYSYYHYTALGYEVIAETIRKFWSRYLAMNVKLFEDVHLIPTD